MSFPTINACLVCDAVRNEPGGKLTLLGLLGPTPDVEVQVGDIRKPVSLAFVFLGAAGGSGEFALSFDLVGADGRQLVPRTAPERITVVPDLRVTLAPQILFAFNEAGAYAFRLFVDDALHFSANFRVKG